MRLPIRNEAQEQVVRKCMSCASELDQNANDLYGRRFCSTSCKEQYMG